MLVDMTNKTKTVLTTKAQYKGKELTAFFIFEYNIMYMLNI